MSDDSSAKTEPASARQKAWGISGGIGFGALAFVVPQLALSELSPVLLPLLPFSANAQNFIFMGLVELLTILAIVMIVNAYGQSLRDLGLGTWKWGFIWKTLLAMVVYLALTIAISTVVGMLVHVDFNQEQDIGFASPSGIELVLVFLGLVVLPPLAEELLFRGFLYKGIRSRLSFVPATLVVSGLFALAHGQLNVGLDVFALSLVLCWLREKTGSLWPGIMLHGLKNAVAFFVLFVYTGPK